ncbi:efflux pump antibiotic resistance protein [Penicillium manginii]|jgi:MFS family permease|uniref:efflux pump antibiotic resistance protein n=1 Tax=Penicillium manginii TaxID=203109 RepID=UPI0025470015|nr:efflux pump antibiotic resistance protein [Penicillium manginii]KAJ5741440.1 efflux pump antibiotic resistance protein [Penicillium manginii]
MTVAEQTIPVRSEGMEMTTLPGDVVEYRARLPTTIAGNATRLGENTTQEMSSHSGSFAGNRSPTGVKFWLLMLNLGAVLILISIDMNIVATAVPTITDHFHSVADVGWYSSAFRLCQCAFQFVFGKAYRLFSIKRVFLLANVISIVGSLLSGIAVTSTMLILGRAVAGLGAAGLLSGCFIILVQSTDLRRRPMFTGIMGAVEGLATLSAPILGGAIVQSLGWRWCFYINGPIGVVTIMLTIFCFADTPKPGGIERLELKQKISQLDLMSNMLLIPAMTGLFLALSWAGTKYPWNSGPVISPLISFILLTAAFIYNQKRRGNESALPLRIMKHRSIIAGFIFIMCVNSTGSVLEYYLPTYYQVVRGYTPAKSGYMMLPIIIAGTIGSLVHGFGTSIFGYYAPFMVFASTILPIAAGLITTVKINTSFTQLIIYTGFSGLAYGIGFSGPQNAVQTVLVAEDVPLGTSIMLFAQSFGPTVAVAIAQVLFVNQLSTNLNVLIPGISQADLGTSSLNHIVASVSSEKSRDVLIAIDKSLIQTWYLVVGLACTTMIGSLLIEWRSVKSRRD